MTALVYNFSVALLTAVLDTPAAVNCERSSLISVVPLDDFWTTRDGLFPLLVVGAAEETYVSSVTGNCAHAMLLRIVRSRKRNHSA